MITQQDYINAMRKFEARHSTICLEKRPVEILAIVGALQLAMRHPLFPETTEKVCREFIQDVCTSLDDPILAAVIEMGYNPDFDSWGPDDAGLSVPAGLPVPNFSELRHRDDMASSAA